MSRKYKCTRCRKTFEYLDEQPICKASFDTPICPDCYRECAVCGIDCGAYIDKYYGMDVGVMTREKAKQIGLEDSQFVVKITLYAENKFYGEYKDGDTLWENTPKEEREYFFKSVKNGEKFSTDTYAYDFTEYLTQSEHCPHLVLEDGFDTVIEVYEVMNND